MRGTWGYIDRGGNFIIKPVWTRAFNFTEGKAEVRNSKGEAYLIDKGGNIIKRINPDFVYNGV
ncbi:MAG: WG repeat-containing protein [Pseudomonadota bacterium]